MIRFVFRLLSEMVRRGIRTPYIIHVRRRFETFFPFDRAVRLFHFKTAFELLLLLLLERLL